jgi:folate-binding protein YgfZ
VENHQGNLQVTHIISESPPTIFYSYPNKRLGQTGYDIVFEKNQESTLENFLKEKDAVQMTQNQIEVLRIKNGICRVGVDATTENLPQESRLERALHFNKGCYLGQEVIARLHFRGHVNKILCRFESIAKSISVNETVLNDETPVGKITSVAFDESEQKSYILAYVPLALKESGKMFLTSSTKVKIILID